MKIRLWVLDAVVACAAIVVTCGALTYNYWNAAFDIRMVRVKGGTFSKGCPEEQNNYCYSDTFKEYRAHRDTTPYRGAMGNPFQHLGDPAVYYDFFCAGCDGIPKRNVPVSDFFISRKAVTDRLWLMVMGYIPPVYTDGGKRCSNDEKEIFIQKLNEKTGKKYRLLTIDELNYMVQSGYYGFGGLNYPALGYPTPTANDPHARHSPTDPFDHSVGFVLALDP